MPINSAPLTANPSVLSDWIELSVVRSNRGRFRLATLQRAFDTRRDTEDSDSTGENAREDNTDAQGVSGAADDVFIEAIADEIGDRAEVLQDAYPFEFSDDGTLVKLKENIPREGYIYLFCLLLANSKKGDLLEGSWLPQIDNRTRDLFQACATLAAAGHVAGSAVSFGWPRPNQNPPFLEALTGVYKRFGEGVVVNAPRAGASPSPKDEEIDLIAWKPTRGKMPGTHYMLGQVASGDNWEAKSIKGGPIVSFHGMWFQQPPQSDAIASIFIPHAIAPGHTGTRRDMMARHTYKYGIVFDRFRLPSDAAAGIKIAESGTDGIYVERLQDIPAVVQWVDSQVQSLRAA